jgi:two-component system, OmpR family, alkaline phosphatase synthesis response regulator PhoP
MQALNMSKILVLARDSESIQILVKGLTLKGYDCDIISSEDELASREFFDLLVIEVKGGLIGTVLGDKLKQIKQERQIIIILLAEKKSLQDLENEYNIDDFILEPYDITELSVRINWLLRNNKVREESVERLIAGDVTIDLPRCEVWVAGKVVDLTFTEYELLKLLIKHKGHVLTREVLLNEIWGYDYFGGDRTVDVREQ